MYVGQVSRVASALGARPRPSTPADATVREDLLLRGTTDVRTGCPTGPAPAPQTPGGRAPGVARPARHHPQPDTARPTKQHPQPDIAPSRASTSCTKAAGDMLTLNSGGTRSSPPGADAAANRAPARPDKGAAYSPRRARTRAKASARIASASSGVRRSIT